MCNETDALINVATCMIHKASQLVDIQKLVSTSVLIVFFALNVFEDQTGLFVVISLHIAKI